MLENDVTGKDAAATTITIPNPGLPTSDAIPSEKNAIIANGRKMAR